MSFSQEKINPVTCIISASLCILFVLAFAPFSLSASPYEETIAEGRAAAEEAMAGCSASSISLALVDEDQVVWTETFEKRASHLPRIPCTASAPQARSWLPLRS